MRVVGIVLAGGRSRRMKGGDKSFAKLAGRPLVEHVVSRLLPQVSVLVVSANGPPEQYASLGVPIIADTIPDRAGPLAGLLAGFLWAQANEPSATHVVTAAVDTPFFPTDLVERLSSAAGPNGTAMAFSAGRPHPVFALVPVSAADDLRAFITSGASLRVGDWLGRRGVREVHFPIAADGFDPFFNLNTPADLARAEEMHRRLRVSRT